MKKPWLPKLMIPEVCGPSFKRAGAEEEAEEEAECSSRVLERGCSSVPNVKRPMQKSSYVLRSYVGISKEMKIVENYEMKFVFLDSPAEML